ncbi:THAP domain-containing 9 [Paramuricea clavata]|uniref:THAP domain-containing 9, partial n=1 Tax=Paramuricea clavata TaxID=317549 RepID=A0A6S7FKJ9_PARCT|nr:THAP domain-containing 9 [Paramuricea clavata]
MESFALTLQFYSAKAYEFVRKTFNIALPSQSQIRRWYGKVQVDPGFTQPAFNTLKVKDAEKNGKKVICSLMMDEMAIKKHISWDGNKYNGYVDLGDGINDDSLPVAADALVFIVVSVDGSWKVPCGYFFVNGLSGEERANLVKKDDTIDTEKIWVLLDVCHVLKLVRNTLAEKAIILDKDNGKILWQYLVDQNDEGLRLCNKLKKAHIQWQQQKMKANLAAQSLSSSVADAIEYCVTTLKLPQFQGSEGHTAYKRLLLRSHIEGENGSCKKRDPIEILSAVSNSSNINGKTVTTTDAALIRKYDLQERTPMQSDHDYCDFPNIARISEYKEAALSYIGGFVTKYLKNKLPCHKCRNVLGSQKIIPSSQFLQLKDRGNLFKPSESVMIVCQKSEKCFQRMLTINAGKLPQGEGIVEAIATSVLAQFNYRLLKTKQETCIKKLVVDCEDVFAVLPTGYGKSLIYQILPLVFTEMDVLEYGQCNDTHTVIVVSPLEYIRVQRVENLKRLRLRAVLLDASLVQQKGYPHKLYIALLNNGYLMPGYRN